MNDFDIYSANLLEQAKRFLEKAKNVETESNSRDAFLNASLLISISSLEAYINGIVEDFSKSEFFSLVEIGFLTEREIELKNGQFVLTNRLKMSRLTDRIEMLFYKFTCTLVKSDTWWSNLSRGIKLRNAIVHPKENKILEISEVERTLLSVITCIDLLFKAIYKSGLPSARMELVSSLNF